MIEEDLREKWDRIYRSRGGEVPPEPAQVLAENTHLLPAAGGALDLAAGLGGNALYLARRGLETHAWDISTEAMTRLEALAASLALPVRTEVRDVIRCPPPPETFDVVVVSRFLERSLTPFLIQALKPGGLLFYQTYTLDKDPGVGPSDPAYLLLSNELLDLFRELRLLVYREEGRAGNLSVGFRNQALLVGQKI